MSTKPCSERFLSAAAWARSTPKAPPYTTGSSMLRGCGRIANWFCTVPARATTSSFGKVRGSYRTSNDRAAGIASKRPGGGERLSHSNSTRARRLAISSAEFGQSSRRAESPSGRARIARILARRGWRRRVERGRGTLVNLVARRRRECAAVLVLIGRARRDADSRRVGGRQGAGRRRRAGRNVRALRAGGLGGGNAADRDDALPLRERPLLDRDHLRAAEAHQRSVAVAKDVVLALDFRFLGRPELTPAAGGDTVFGRCGGRQEPEGNHESETCCPHTPILSKSLAGAPL